MPTQYIKRIRCSSPLPPIYVEERGRTAQHVLEPPTVKWDKCKKWGIAVLLLFVGVAAVSGICVGSGDPFLDTQSVAAVNRNTTDTSSVTTLSSAVTFPGIFNQSIMEPQGDFRAKNISSPEHRVEMEAPPLDMDISRNATKPTTESGQSSPTDIQPDTGIIPVES